MFGMDPWQVWLVAAIVLTLAEIFVPGVFLVFFGFGAGITAVFSAFNDSLNSQLVLFAASSLTMTILSRTLLRPLFFGEGQKAPPTNVFALKGREALVTEDIQGPQHPGAVKIGGEVWTAHSLSGEPIAKETLVVVERVDGAKVWVRPQAVSLVT
jgi:membrane protein implicated in regulation of membrane protease activity